MIGYYPLLGHLVQVQKCRRGAGGEGLGVPLDTIKELRHGVYTLRPTGGRRISTLTAHSADPQSSGRPAIQSSITTVKLLVSDAQVVPEMVNPAFDKLISSARFGLI